MKNPFEYGNIVTNGSFCNREQEQQDIIRSIENAQNMILYSERRLGKSSLVKTIMNNLPKSDYYLTYVDLWPTDSEASFIKTMASELAEAHQSRGEKLLEWTTYIFNILSPTLTMTTAGEPQLDFSLSSTGENLPALKDILTAPQTIYEQTGKRVVVILDEIQKIHEYESDNVETQLRSIAQTQSDVCYLYLGSRRHVIQEMFMDEGSPLYKSGTTYPLKPIELEHWESFIARRFEQANKNISHDIIQSIVNQTDGHPFYTQHLCHVLWEITEEDSTATPGKLKTAIDTLLEREQEVFITQLEALTKNQKRLLIGLAFEEHQDEIYAETFTRKYGLTSAKIQRAIESLKKKDLVDLTEQGYMVRDRFLRLWLQKRFESINFN